LAVGNRQTSRHVHQHIPHLQLDPTTLENEQLAKLSRGQAAGIAAFRGWLARRLVLAACKMGKIAGVALLSSMVANLKELHSSAKRR